MRIKKNVISIEQGRACVVARKRNLFELCGRFASERFLFRPNTPPRVGSFEMTN
jgi:hypothetical protein